MPVASTWWSAGALIASAARCPTCAEHWRPSTHSTLSSFRFVSRWTPTRPRESSFSRYWERSPKESEISLQSGYVRDLGTPELRANASGVLRSLSMLLESTHSEPQDIRGARLLE